ncbi:carboxymuconolactone decarboxylase family protein [Streptomyces sp. NPDC051561]|uniref:carboxymuconolactone decarboxylase family protein n=1 Tax=Streptomyces sp. NPDC051561 TaxID=3365658 RepID=UPI0037936887
MTGPFRFTSPEPPESATGTTAAVYQQVLTDFGVPHPPTFAVLSASPELLSGFWALMREALLSGAAPRTDKELVAAGTSLTNGCHFCVNAHLFLLHAGGEPTLADHIGEGRPLQNPGHAQLLSWGRDIGTEQPFPAAHAQEYIGTALAFHFMNRIADTLLARPPLDSADRRARLLETALGQRITATVRRQLTPGESLLLLRTEGDAPSWATPGSAVAIAYAGLREAATMGAGLLSDDDVRYVRKTVDAWDGLGHLSPDDPRLPLREDRPGARIALLAALAPHHLTEEDVQMWKVPPYTDHCLLHLVAYGAMAATERQAARLPAPAKPEPA